MSNNHNVKIHKFNIFIPILFSNILRKLLILPIILAIYSLCLTHNAKADDTLDNMVKVFKNLTCETKGIGNLLRTDDFAHTCIPEPFLNYAVFDFFSLGMYSDMVLRLSIKDNNHACDRGERIDFNDKKMSFSLCNNAMLIAARSEVLGKVIADIATTYWDKAMGHGDGKFVANWSLPKSKYHKYFNNKKVGDSGVVWDVALDSGAVISVAPWKIIKDDDKLCVATISAFGWVPVGCKYVKEPFPISIYSDFMDLSSEGSDALATASSLTKCGNMGSCFKNAHKNSKTGVVMTGPVVGCVKEMIAKLMISSSVCGLDDINNVLNSSSRTSSSLFNFQRYMHQTVSALLTIYVILFGFKIILAGDIPKKSDLMNFVFKFLFVIYFSIGINISSSDAGPFSRIDGISEWALPFLLNGMNELASWLINATPSNLCDFSDVKYEKNFEYLRLWDALDCKISHYIGLDMMQTMVVENSSMHHDWSKLDGLSFPIPPYIPLLAVALYTGNITLAGLIVMYPLLVISIGAFILNAVVVSMISIVILTVLAPLIVPMFLFEYTKGYFDAWVKLLLSFMLQPMVAVAFMTFMLSIYDLGFYGTCKYTNSNITYSGAEFSVKLSVGPVGVGGGMDNRTVRYSYLDNDWSKYTKEEYDGCVNSLGYMLNNPLAFIYNTGDKLGDGAAMPWINDAKGGNGRFDFLKAIQKSPGMLFDSVKVIFEQIKTLMLAMLTACFILYLIYHFSAQLTGFMADMTGGIELSKVAIGPQSFAKAQSNIQNAMQQASDKISQRGGVSSDKASTGGNESSDKVSTGGGESSDQASTGGGSSGGGSSGGEK